MIKSMCLQDQSVVALYVLIAAILEHAPNGER